MSTINKKSSKDQFGWLRAIALVLMIVHFGCKAVCANNKTDDLKQIIAQIRSIQFEPPTVGQDEPSAAGQAEPQQPATPENKNQKTEDREQKTESQPSFDVADSETNNDKMMSNQTLHKVDELLKDPNSIANPLELAEVLFQTGALGPAGLCYKQAFASIAADDPNVASERAWILFQTGNCLKDNDPNASKESYAELIRTHPDSPWAEIAKTKHGLLDWYQQEQPRKLIEELKR